MKKLFLILIILKSFFLNFSAYAKEIYLNCERDKLISMDINGKVEVDKGLARGIIFKLNTVKKKVFIFMEEPKIFIDKSDYNLKWKKEVITWKQQHKPLSENDSAYTTYSTLNRLNLELLESTLYEDDKYFKKLDQYYRCEIIEKKI